MAAGQTDSSMANGPLAPESSLALSDKEQQALDLYDRLQDLRLEIAIINAQNDANPEVLNETLTGDEARAAQTGLLEARARCSIKNQVTEAVMTVNPILKAVHYGVDASPVERDLLKHVQQRDQAAELVISHTHETSQVREVMNKVQSETFQVCRENISLTSELFELVEEMKQKKPSKSSNPKVQRELDRSNTELAMSRQRWKVVKGLASGVVAGSGINWAQDEALENMVLDPEDDDL